MFFPAFARVASGFFFLGSLLPFRLWAATAEWNCQPSPDGKEWVCAARKPGEATPPSAEPSPAPEPAAPPPAAARAPVAPEPEPSAAPPAEPDRAATEPEPSRAREEVPLSRQQAGAAVVTPPPPRVQAEAQQPGWSCQPGAESKEWNCALTGPDPQGRTHLVREPSEVRENWAESTTITDDDEQRFANMMALLPVDPWSLTCGKSENAPMTQFLLSPQDKLARLNAPVEIRSDYGEVVEEELFTATGSAVVERADQKLFADLVSQNTAANSVNARGNVVYQEKGLTFSSDTAFLDLDTDQGVFRNSQFILETVPARGTSRLTHFDSKDLSRYETFSYTSCPPGDRDWMLHADKVKVNKETGQGSAQHAWLEFKGVPFLYSPYLSFPVDDRRQSGFLTPSFAYTQVSGFDFRLPYYFNLAPNYDLTIAPRVLSERGFWLGSEFRYLTPYNRGRVLGEIMPQDTERDEVRGQVGWLDDAWFGPNVQTHVNANYVSDDRYLNELGNSLDLVDRRFIRSNARAAYTGSNYGVTTSMDYFQTIDPTVLTTQRPYWRLPQLSAYYSENIAGTGLQFFGYGEMANFVQDERLTGQRLNLKPRLSYPMRGAAGFIVPSVTLQSTQYWLQDADTPGACQDPSGCRNRNRTLPIVSLDSGLFIERDVEIGDSAFVHTVEPRLYYLYIPYDNQQDIPVFDTSNYDFTFYQLFRENRFAGADRLGDANQVTAALTTRLVDQSSGLDRLRASLGEIFYFQDRRVTLPGFTPQTAGQSNLIGEVFGMLTDRWSLRAGGQWNPDRDRAERALLALQYDDRNNNLFNLAYRYLDQPSNQDFTVDLADASMRLPIAEGWHVIGRWQYSLKDEETLEAFAGIERETCCWRLSLIGRHYINNFNSKDGDAQANTGVFFQLELKGLTRFGDQVDRFLYRSLGGYRLRDDLN